MNFINGAQLLEYCEKENKKISEAMFEREVTHLEADPERTMEKMRKAYSIMKGSVKKPMEEDIISTPERITDMARFPATMIFFFTPMTLPHLSAPEQCRLPSILRSH